jgi:gamma-glutamyltranspeptidase/glutathione hydrolase
MLGLNGLGWAIVSAVAARCRRYATVALALLIATLTACGTTQPRAFPAPTTSSGTAAVVESQGGALAMPDEFSADAARLILNAGGNAVDAAIAAAFVLAVTYPEAGNIGGGGFMLVRVHGEAGFIDYREVAPAAASRDMYLDARGEVVGDQSLTGHRAVGVPGTVAGLWLAHQRFGTRPWGELLRPAIQLATDGFIVPAQLEERMKEDLQRLQRASGFTRYFGGLRAGERFRQPDLARTLERIATRGAAGFYRGRTARLIAQEMKRGHGLIDMADLRGYRALWRHPLRAQWRGYEVLSAPPPSSGGFAVIQLLKMSDALQGSLVGVTHNSSQYIHVVAEMEKRVFADRAQYLGDPDFTRVPVERLIDDRYVAARAAQVDLRQISPLSSVGPGLGPEPHQTTHFSIVDGAGNAVANTYTLNTEFGSGVVVSGAGFLLNNQMDDFSLKPGVPNYYGVVGSVANEIQPGKRMLSSMSPTLLVRDGRVRLVVGSPGGSTIISSVFQTIMNVVQFGMTAQQAVAAPRVHHQLLPPTEITFSPGVPLPEETQSALRARGYEVHAHPWEMGDVQLIWDDGRGWRAAADPRGRGAVR